MLLKFVVDWSLPIAYHGLLKIPWIFQYVYNESSPWSRGLTGLKTFPRMCLREGTFVPSGAVAVSTAAVFHDWFLKFSTSGVARFE
jgi:hypothetical protein